MKFYFIFSRSSLSCRIVTLQKWKLFNEEKKLDQLDAAVCVCVWERLWIEKGEKQLWVKKMLCIELIFWIADKFDLMNQLSSTWWHWKKKKKKRENKLLQRTKLSMRKNVYEYATYLHSVVFSSIMLWSSVDSIRIQFHPHHFSFSLLCVHIEINLMVFSHWIQNANFTKPHHRRLLRIISLSSTM